MRAFAPGIYPRSEALVQATRDLERGRTSPKVVDEQGERDFQELVSVQRAADLSFLSDGMLGWQDLFRPLAEAAEGLDARPLTRFLDTNTFYRGVLVDGEPRLRNPLPPPDLRTGNGSGRCLRRSRSRAPLATRSRLRRWPRTSSDHRSRPGWMPAPHSSSSASRLPPVKEAQTPAARPRRAPGCAPRTPASLRRRGVDPARAHGGQRLCDRDRLYATSLDALPSGFPKEILAGVIDARSSGRRRSRRDRALRRGTAARSSWQTSPRTATSSSSRSSSPVRLLASDTRPPNSRSSRERRPFRHPTRSLAKPSWRVKAFAGRPLEGERSRRGRRVGPQARGQGPRSTRRTTARAGASTCRK